ncbi:MAG: CehA/McbA family metallohydrolase [Clostridia bacterium]
MIKYYPAELHTHTLHSDGTFTPESLARAAKAEGLSVIALTDHNTIAGIQPLSKEGQKVGITVIHGIEWTTFYGHITVLGGDLTQKWECITPQNIIQVVRSVRERGGLVGIAHPFRIGYPICTGGSDEWGLEDYQGFTHYEVWSYLSPSVSYTNHLAEQRYASLCRRGVKLAVVYRQRQA